ncbi:MAG: hypothetical protein ACLRPV_01460 [Lacrimispora saccharolytica]|nr:hypothetical protein [Lachnospiraceae bacterium]
MRVEMKELKSLIIDVENKRYLLNGEEMAGISRLDLDFANGKWTLLITKDEMYQTAPGAEKVTE